MDWTKNQWLPLLKTTDFKTFLFEALKYYFRKKERVNISEFSRKAGFSSRSYLTEVLIGKKGLSKDALRKIRNTLKVPKEISKIGECLAFLDFPELRPRNITDFLLKTQLKNSRSAFIKRLELDLNKEIKSKVTSSTSLYLVFASVGSVEEGAALEDIGFRCKLSNQTIDKNLKVLKEAGIVIEKSKRFYPVSDQIDFFDMKSSDGLAELIKRACNNLSDNAKEVIENLDNLTFYTAFSVDTVQVPELRRKLKEAIYTVLDDFQNDDGNTVRQILFSLQAPTLET